MPSTEIGNATHKTAIITGGSRGLGRNTALNLARRGVDVIFTYRANQAEANSLIREFEAMGRKAAAFRLDTGDTRSFDGFAGDVRKTLQSWGRERFDYLVNNAGNSLHAAFAETSEAQFDEIFRVHVKGVYFLTQKLLPLMNDGGRIVNISSGLARFAFPGSSAYGAAKGAVEVLTRYLAKELGPRRITANVVAPGAIQTDFSGGMVRDNPEINKHVADVTALGRAGVPDDIGPMIAALLSDDNRWVNAQRIEVSGGMAL
jgi:NAD(P)-dependent dehydrogenase (short-subunit alcohol dehydrogenase family)